MAGLLGACLLGSGLGAWAQRGAPDGQDGPGGMMGPNGKGVMGTVTAVTADGFTVKTPDGEAWKVTVGPNTRIVHEREAGSISDLKPGFGVGAFGQADTTTPNTLHALFASYQTAAEVKARMADFGKTWMGGKVTAVDGTKITITVQRPGQAAPSTSTMVVDETTSFKKGREEVTLADLKAGDYVMGKGGVKDGSFVPTELTIRAPGGRRGGMVGGAPGSSPDDKTGAPAAPANEKP